MIASPTEVPAFTYEVEIEETDDNIVNDEAFIPVTEIKESTIDVKIANITRVALITVVYSEPLKLAESHLAITYE